MLRIRWRRCALFDAFASVAAGARERASGGDRRCAWRRASVRSRRWRARSAQSSPTRRIICGCLRESGLVRSRRDGDRVVYRLASDRVADLWAAVRDVAAQHVAEVSVLAGEYLGDRDGIEQLSARRAAGAARPAARWWCWTCGRRRSTGPGISPARFGAR